MANIDAANIEEREARRGLGLKEAKFHVWTTMTSSQIVSIKTMKNKTARCLELMLVHICICKGYAYSANINKSQILCDHYMTAVMQRIRVVSKRQTEGRV